MTEFCVKLAGIPVEIRALYPETEDFLRDYRCGEAPALSLGMEPEDLVREQAFAEETMRADGEPVREVPPAYLERLALYRKLADALLEREVLLFHGSVVAVDGAAYLFAARSGTGKSTHTRLWRRVFGERAVMINDDKPLLLVREEGVTAFGTPWNGKHRLGGNLSAPLKAICILERDARNHIEPVAREDAFAALYQQCYRPEAPEAMPAVLALLERLSRKVKLYRLGCNMEPEAAVVSYQGMQEEET